jgi:hypothetical protein
VEQISVGRRSSLAAGARANSRVLACRGSAGRTPGPPSRFGSASLLQENADQVPLAAFGPAAFYLKGVAPPEISLQGIGKAHWRFPA